VPGWQGYFQVNGIVILSSGGSIPPFGTKTSRVVEHTVVGTGSTNFASKSL